jgi:hypothetical protein
MPVLIASLPADTIAIVNATDWLALHSHYMLCKQSLNQLAR